MKILWPLLTLAPFAAACLYFWFTRPSARVRRLLDEVDLLNEVQGLDPSIDVRHHEGRLFAEALELGVVGTVAARRARQ